MIEIDWFWLVLLGGICGGLGACVGIVGLVLMAEWRDRR